MSDKKKNISAQNRHEDEVLNRALLWIGGAAILILFLLFLNRFYVNYRTTEINLAAGLAKALPIITGIALAGCVAGILLALNARKQGRSMKWWTALAVLFGGLALCGGLTWRFHGTAVQFLCGLVLAVAVLALVYYLFQHEFFIISVCSAVGITGLWLIRQETSHTVILYGFLLCAALFLLAAALLTRTLQKNGGEWKGRRLLSKKAAYSMVYLTCAIVAVLLIAALALGINLAYYLMFPAVGWLVVMAVYFTVKLM